MEMYTGGGGSGGGEVNQDSVEVQGKPPQNVPQWNADYFFNLDSSVCWINESAVFKDQRDMLARDGRRYHGQVKAARKSIPDDSQDSPPAPADPTAAQEQLLNLSDLSHLAAPILPQQWK